MWMNTLKQPIDNGRETMSETRIMESAGYPPHSSALPDRRWYCIALLSNLERMAQAGLDEIGLDSLFLKKAERRDSKDPWKIKPLFPGYAFVSFDMRCDPWQNISDTPGVYRLFRHGPEMPTPLPRGVVEGFKSKADQFGVIYPPDPRIMRKDDPGKVIDGPFTGFEGICAGSDRDRVWMMLELLGRSTKVEFRREAVEAIAV